MRTGLEVIGVRCDSEVLVATASFVLNPASTIVRAMVRRFQRAQVLDAATECSVVEDSLNRRSAVTGSSFACARANLGKYRS